MKKVFDPGDFGSGDHSAAAGGQFHDGSVRADLEPCRPALADVQRTGCFSAFFAKDGPYVSMKHGVERAHVLARAALDALLRGRRRLTHRRKNF